MAKHAGGRPPKFKDVEELEKAIEKYFKETNPEEYTISGLGLALNLTTQSILNYEDKDDKFFATIKRAKQRIEQSWEIRLIKKGRSGDIFALKNFGWKDKQELDHGASTFNVFVNSK